MIKVAELAAPAPNRRDRHYKKSIAMLKMRGKYWADQEAQEDARFMGEEDGVTLTHNEWWINQNGKIEASHSEGEGKSSYGLGWGFYVTPKVAKYLIEEVAGLYILGFLSAEELEMESFY